MASFWKALGKMFKPAPDPAQAALERRIKMNRLQSRFSLEVKKQDKFLREYLGQAVEAKRTGDGATLKAIKSVIARTLAMRRRAQRMLNATRLLATTADQMESYKEFCGVMAEVSEALGQGLTAGEVAKTQADLARGLQQAQSVGEMMDQMLGALDATIGEMADREEESGGIKESALDEMIAKLAGEKDSAAESRIEELLAKI
ncbi:MAG: hypothetical protein IKQ55_01940 [Kiritimatiellae bacterium]|nr:hypothetical protein [Kiritimatiellia bacterium]